MRDLRSGGWLTNCLAYIISAAVAATLDDNGQGNRHQRRTQNKTAQTKTTIKGVGLQWERLGWTQILSLRCGTARWVSRQRPLQVYHHHCRMPCPLSVLPSCRSCPLSVMFSALFPPALFSPALSPSRHLALCPLLLSLSPSRPLQLFPPDRSK